MFKDPFIISSMILAFCFFFILLCNNVLKNKIIKMSFLILGFICLILIIIFDNPYIYELLRYLITFLWYPNYLFFVSVVLISVLIFIYTMLKKKIMPIKKILNYLIFCISFCLYIIFLRIDINPNSYVSLYSKDSLLVMRILNISFALYLIAMIVISVVKRGKNEK